MAVGPSPACSLASSRRRRERPGHAAPPPQRLACSLICLSAMLAGRAGLAAAQQQGQDWRPEKQASCNLVHPDIEADMVKQVSVFAQQGIREEVVNR
jgi:hypothetical protein